MELNNKKKSLLLYCLVCVYVLGHPLHFVVTVPRDMLFSIVLNSRRWLLTYIARRAYLCSDTKFASENFMVLSDPSKAYMKQRVYQGYKNPRTTKFLPLCLKFFSPQYWNCFISPFPGPEFWCGSHSLEEFGILWCRLHSQLEPPTMLKELV